MRTSSARRPLSYAQFTAEKCARSPESRRSSEATFTSEQLSLIKRKKTDEGLTFALQALLDRHESFVKESQAEQARSAAYVVELEVERANLQANNESIRIENRGLLEKLEQVDAELGAKEDRVKELENLLQDCEKEVTRLNNLRHLTLDLEHKLDEVERERAEALQVAQDCKAESRSTIARWRESERKIKELEREVRRIELKANADLQRHEEIVTRLSRGHELERSLSLSEGRLKASTAIQTMRDGNPRAKQVVSNFVRDILQDNVNLQAGIAELRQLLATSNEEVQTLRERVILHQPMSEELSVSQQSLDDEIELNQSVASSLQQQVHVHHHYHPGTKKTRTPLRRAKQRRVLMPGTVPSSHSSTAPSTCSTPSLRSTRLPTDVNLPPSTRVDRSRDHRWSIQSSNTASTYFSSMASSPHSYLDKELSVFDRIDCGDEDSRPTSPDLSEMNSPLPFTRKHRGTHSSLVAFVEEDEDISPSEVPPLDAEQIDDSGTPSVDDTISHIDQNDHMSSVITLRAEVNSQSNSTTTPSLQPRSETLQSSETPPTPTIATVVTATETQTNDRSQLDLDLRPSHRRRNSTDSLVSISGMDIHIAQRPRASASTALALLSRSNGANKHHFAPSPVAAKTRQIGGTAKPSAVVTEVAAVSRPGADNVSASMMALTGIAREQVKSVGPPSRPSAGLFGGWISRKWGVAPAKSVADLRSAHSSTNSPASISVHATAPISAGSGGAGADEVENRDSTCPTAKPKTDPSLMRHLNSTTTQSKMAKDFFVDRSPGINQSGAIPGLAAMLAARASPVVVNPERIDVDGLRDGLSEA